MKTVIAQRASDKTNDWPIWFVSDGGLNVTAPVGFALTQGFSFNHGQVFARKQIAEHMAEAWNAWEQST
jgi:hypothetical protein